MPDNLVANQRLYPQSQQPDVLEQETTRQLLYSLVPVCILDFHVKAVLENCKLGAVGGQLQGENMETRPSGYQGATTGRKLEALPSRQADFVQGMTLLDGFPLDESVRVQRTTAQTVDTAEGHGDCVRAGLGQARICHYALSVPYQVHCTIVVPVGQMVVIT
jgi:hypothetical protein